MRCIGCGCTNHRACRGGCSWVTHNPPRCSACIASGRLTLPVGAHVRLDSEDVCPDSPSGIHELVFLNPRSGYCGNCSWPFVATEVA